MKLYGGIDLHGNNNVIALIDEDDKVVFERRIANEVDVVLSCLAPYREEIVALAVESTYNWYWLVDGLMDSGHNVLGKPRSDETVRGAQAYGR